MPKQAICSKISANKMPSGFCGSDFIVAEAKCEANRFQELNNADCKGINK